MKNLLFVSVFMLISTLAFAQVETIAKEVLEAYKSRNVELLKKHASGIFIYAITDGFFEDKSIQEDLKAVDDWDGEIREIRYKSGDMMGEKVHLSSVYFTDVPDNEGMLYTVVLSSTDKQNWVLFGVGPIAETKEEFNNMSTTMAESEVAAEEVKETPNNFAIEMANAEILSKISEQTIVDCINKLDDDNFFAILSNGDDFIQAAYSDKGYSVQYSENEKLLEAKDYFSKDNTIQIFKKYFNGDNNWKEGIDWIAVEY